MFPCNTLSELSFPEQHLTTVYIYYVLYLLCFLHSFPDCERSLHTNCVMKQGSYKLLVEECNEKFLLTCLVDHLTKSICSKNDPDTLSTIKELIKQIRRRFITNKKCANNIFMNTINYHFLGKSYMLFLFTDFFLKAY